MIDLCQGNQREGLESERLEHHGGETKEDRQSDHMKMADGARTNRNESQAPVTSCPEKFGLCYVALQGLHPE